MFKIDFKKELKHLYTASSKTFQVIDVPVMQFLMIDGHGDPNTAKEYKDALETIYPVAYKLKFLSKSRDRDYVVPPLEGLWWADDMAAFTSRAKDEWDWTIMLMVPDWISSKDFTSSVAKLKAEKNLPAIEKLRFEKYKEGLSVQKLHIGSYDDEAESLAFLHEQWLPENGYKETGKHHEIYISDPRRTVPEKLKTILRQPVAQVS
ncbi:MAG: GyrI-like domain-containing protein [Gammaproteobacteria bacterium]|nr:GyrI-like domain-containing protein [Gammaproteobacteria bacterium]